jgi:hypothetical protein
VRWQPGGAEHRCCQPSNVAAGALDLHPVIWPEIADPRVVERAHRCTPGILLQARPVLGRELVGVFVGDFGSQAGIGAVFVTRVE